MVAVISESIFSDFLRKADLLEYELTKYFTCELNGHDPLNPCDRSMIEELAAGGLDILILFLVGTFPTVNLIFVVSIQDTKRRFKFLCDKIRMSCTSKTKKTAVNEEMRYCHV